MSYSVIKYVENGRKCQSVVPSNWVIGKNLYWPRRASEEQRFYKICKDPEADWQEYVIEKELISRKYILLFLAHLLDQLPCNRKVVGSILAIPLI